MATPVPRSAVSPVEAARQAFEHTRRELFPIRFEKWLLLGLLAFLDQCGRSFRGGGAATRGGGGHGPFPTPGDGGAGEAAAWLQRAVEWLTAHAALVTLGLVGGVLVIAVLAAVVLWFNARGVFMYLDAVATGRAELARPWREHAPAAASYFGWSLGISLAGVFVLLFAGGIVAALALGFASGRLQGPGGALSAAALLPVLLLLLLALPLLALAALALRDFVAPLQLATGLPCGAAARLLESLVLANPGAFVVYLLLKVVVVVGSGIAIAIGGCLTCCLGFLPIVMQALFQPFFHFERGLSLFLLRQLGYDATARLQR
jgi:hypothetical protein